MSPRLSFEEFASTLEVQDGPTLEVRAGGGTATRITGLPVSGTAGVARQLLGQLGGIWTPFTPALLTGSQVGLDANASGTDNAAALTEALGDVPSALLGLPPGVIDINAAALPDSTFTFPPGWALLHAPDAIWRPAAGTHLVFNPTILQAGLHQILDLSLGGTAEIADHILTPTQWLGAPWDGVQEDSVFFRRTAAVSRNILLAPSGTGTALVRTVDFEQAGTVVTVAPAAVLKLPDGHTAVDPDDRQMVCFRASGRWQGSKAALIDCNYPNAANLPSVEDWHAIRIAADDCEVYDARIIRVSRNGVAIGGPNEAGTIYRCKAKGISVEDSPNDAVAIYYADTVEAEVDDANGCRTAIAFEDGARNLKLRAPSVRNCTKIFTSIIHTGGTASIVNVDAEGHAIEGCIQAYSHGTGSGAVVDNHGLRMKISGDGWLNHTVLPTPVNVFLLSGFRNVDLDLTMRGGDGIDPATGQIVNESWALISAVPNLRIKADYEASPGRSPVTLVNPDKVTFLPGTSFRYLTGQNKPGVRVEVNSGVRKGVVSIGNDFQPNGNADNMELIVSGGSISDILYLGCTGLENSANRLIDSRVAYKACPGVPDTDVIFGGSFQRLTAANRQRYREFDVHGLTIVDNTATELLRFSVPAITSTPNMGIANIGFTFGFVTSESGSQKEGSVIEVRARVVRLRDRSTALLPVEFVGSPGGDQQGSDALHPTLDPSMFTLAYIGAANPTGEETVGLYLTIDVPQPDQVVALRAALLGWFHGSTVIPADSAPYMS